MQLQYAQQGSLNPWRALPEYSFRAISECAVPLDHLISSEATQDPPAIWQLPNKKRPSQSSLCLNNTVYFRRRVAFR